MIEKNASFFVCAANSQLENVAYEGIVYKLCITPISLYATCSIGNALTVNTCKSMQNIYTHM